MKTKKQLANNILLLMSMWLVLAIVVVSIYGFGALSIFVVGSIISWYIGVSHLAYGITKE